VSTIRLTAAQALVRYVANQQSEPDVSFIAGVWAIFGHGEEAMARARESETSYCIVIETDPLISTEAGGHWWDVAVPEVSERAEVREARRSYETARMKQRLAD